MSCAPRGRTPGPVAAAAADPGWFCQVGGGSNDRLHLNRELNGDGSLSFDSMSWTPNLGSGAPSIYGSWPGGLPGGLDIPGGILVLKWDGAANSPKARSKLRMEVTTGITMSGYPPAIGREDLSRPSSGAITVRWGDMLALAKGAKDLLFVLRNRRGVVVEQVRVDPFLFIGAEMSIAAAQERVRQLHADFRNRCERRLPPDGNDIVVS